MTHKTQDLATVRRRGRGGDRLSSRRSPMIGGDQSRQGAHRAEDSEDSRTNRVPNGPSDPRFSYLTRSFD